jgi:hypothetical protein
MRNTHGANWGTIATVEQENNFIIPYKNNDMSCQMCPPTTSQTGPKRHPPKPDVIPGQPGTKATPRPQPEPEPPPINRPDDKNVAARLSTVAHDDDCQSQPEAQHRETNLPALKACRETFAVAHDPNLQTSMKPDGIEEGDRVINPKAPSTPPTPPVMVPLSDDCDKDLGAVKGHHGPYFNRPKGI